MGRDPTERLLPTQGWARRSELRSWRRFGMFLAIGLPLSVLLLPLAYAAGAALGAVVDGHLTIARNLGFADAYRFRINNEMTWGSGFGQVAQALPMTSASLVAVGLVLAIGRWIYGRKPGSWWTVASRFRWSLFLWGLASVLVASAVFLPLAGWLGDHRYVWPLADLSGVPYGWFSLAPLVATILIRASAEELVFRGWLLQQAGAVNGNAPLLVAMTAALFAVAHQEWGVFRLAVLFVMGLAFGWAALRTNGLELSCGVHAGWNIGMRVFSEKRSLPMGEDGRPVGMLPDRTVGQIACVVVLGLVALLIVEMISRRVSPPQADRSLAQA